MGLLKLLLVSGLSLGLLTGCGGNTPDETAAAAEETGELETSGEALMQGVREELNTLDNYDIYEIFEWIEENDEEFDIILRVRGASSEDIDVETARNRDFERWAVNTRADSIIILFDSRIDSEEEVPVEALEEENVSDEAEHRAEEEYRAREEERREEERRAEEQRQREEEERRKREVEEQNRREEEARQQAEAERKAEEQARREAERQEEARKQEQQQSQVQENVNVTQATVRRAIDGDTIELSDGQRVRLIGVDSPERGENGFQAATNFIASRVEGRTVWLEKDGPSTDRFGRLRRYVWLQKPTNTKDEAQIRSKMLNAQLVANGHARAANINSPRNYSLFRSLR